MHENLVIDDDMYEYKLVAKAEVGYLGTHLVRVEVQNLKAV